MLVNTSSGNLPLASARFFLNFLPVFAKSVHESFQIMWMHIEKGLLYQIEEKKSSLILEKENFQQIRRSVESNSSLNKESKNENSTNLNIILHSFFGLAHAVILFPYSQGDVPLILRNLKKNEVIYFFIQILKNLNFYQGEQQKKF